MREEPIRVLQVLPSLQAAGVENFVMNIYRKIDRKKVQFDFIVHTRTPQMYDEEVKKLGGKIYYFSYKDDKNFIKYCRDLRTFFEEHPEYKIVHGNMQSMMPVYLRAAKRHSVPVRIAHSHIASFNMTIKDVALHFLSRFSKYYSTVNFACSKSAGKYLFGKRKYLFIPNAIDVEKFKFSNENRKKVRGSLGISDGEFVVGHVGRFELQKNHKRLIEIFKEIRKKNHNAHLLLIGDGALKNNIMDLAKTLQLEDVIHILSVKKDIEKYYSAMDVFVLPSLFEGLPTVMVEAECNGLSCVVSKNIDRQADVLGQATFLGLELSDKKWADAVVEADSLESARKMSYKKMSSSDFNVNREAVELENYYLESSRRSK